MRTKVHDQSAGPGASIATPLYTHIHIHIHKQRGRTSIHHPTTPTHTKASMVASAAASQPNAKFMYRSIEAERTCARSSTPTIVSVYRDHTDDARGDRYALRIVDDCSVMSCGNA
ncbi:unnamed protein product [Cylicocyclus nassatus]|uniref:Uncharacterized protein n=1 Tax=Cylicocyclus nassatus TaxID=53992 RepID=A0AA36GX84_CYLNA|nr:unnamed protein product [Cylicocyclus nassatus]